MEVLLAGWLITYLVTPTLTRRFRLGAYVICWLVVAGLQRYVTDTGTHGAAVGAYLPDVLLAFAAIPFWTLLFPALIDAIAAAAAQLLTRGAMRVLDWINAIGLVAYAFGSVAVLFFVAFTNYGT
jgi:hypothetical protein